MAATVRQLMTDLNLSPKSGTALVQHVVHVSVVIIVNIFMIIILLFIINSDILKYMYFAFRYHKLFLYKMACYLREQQHLEKLQARKGTCTCFKGIELVSFLFTSSHNLMSDCHGNIDYTFWFSFLVLSCSYS